MTVKISVTTDFSPTGPAVSGRLYGSRTFVDVSNTNILRVGQYTLYPTTGVGIGTTAPNILDYSGTPTNNYRRISYGFLNDGYLRYDGWSTGSDISVDSSVATIDTQLFGSGSGFTNTVVRGRLDIQAAAYNQSTSLVIATMFRQLHFMFSWNASGTITQRLNVSNANSDYNSDATNLPVTKATIVTSGNDVFFRASRYSTSTSIFTDYNLRLVLLDTLEKYADINGIYNMSSLGIGNGYT